MKRLVAKILYFLPFLVLVIAVNLHVDPANIFSDRTYEEDIANIILRGENVANLYNFDERQLQISLIEKIDESSEISVLGSSRSMQIDQGMFPGKNFYNNSVSGASVEDFLGIYELFQRADRMPEKIILGLDPWILNRFHGRIRWKTLKEQYFTITERAGLREVSVVDQLSDLIPQDYFELISPSYFQQSFKLLRKGKNGDYYATHETTGKVAIRLADGSLSYADSFRELPLEKANQKALEYASTKPIYALGRFSKLDLTYRQEIEYLVEDFLERGGKMVFFLPPYHPTVYDAMMAGGQYRIVSDVESFFRRLGEEKGIEVVGSYDPGRAGLSDADFYDGMHPKRAAVGRMFAASGLWR